MSPRQRHLHDLHRIATHSNLAIQETPMSAIVGDLMRRRIQANAFKSTERTRPGLMVNGGGFQGKTETVCEIAAKPTAWTPRHLRRLASLKLAEMTAGGTWKQCAEQLGIPGGAAERSIEVLRRQLGRAGLWEDFDDIAEQIARALDEDEHRVNYAARRRALEHWQIPEDHWAALCTDPHLAGSGRRTGPLDPGIGTVLA